jgi:ubiquinone/menaquinone biosynthesis C-methylase UbiE
MRIPTLASDNISVADVIADVSKPLPFKDGEFDALIARHIFEHIQNPITTLREWKRVVKPGGRLLIVVPDQGVSHTIPMNPEHVHSYTLESLTDLANAVGLELVASETGYNGVSLLAVFTTTNQSV